MSGKQNRMMKRTVYMYIVCLIGMAYSSTVMAQDFKGIVYELESSLPLWNVSVKNLRT